MPSLFIDNMFDHLYTATEVMPSYLRLLSGQKICVPSSNFFCSHISGWFGLVKREKIVIETLSGISTGNGQGQTMLIPREHFFL